MSTISIDHRAPDATVWRLSSGLLIVAAAVGLLSIVPFWDALKYMFDTWLDLPEYSHGLLIPLVAGFLVWQQKDRLERLPFSGSWAGVVIVLLGGVMLVMGQLGTVWSLVQYAYVVTLYGLTLA